MKNGTTQKRNHHDTPPRRQKTRQNNVRKRHRNGKEKHTEKAHTEARRKCSKCPFSRVRVCVFFLAKQPPPLLKSTLIFPIFTIAPPFSFPARACACVHSACVSCGGGAVVGCSNVFLCGCSVYFPAVRPVVHYTEASFLPQHAVSVRCAPHTGQKVDTDSCVFCLSSLSSVFPAVRPGVDCVKAASGGSSRRCAGTFRAAAMLYSVLNVILFLSICICTFCRDCPSRRDNSTMPTPAAVMCSLM